MPESVALTNDQKRELDNRLDAHHLRPDEGSPWEKVRKRIQKHE
ncbi:MAG: addiction module protein [Planctomycetota bacterium]